MNKNGVFIAGLLIASGGHSVADRCDRVLRRMEGWTIVKATSISGAFEGCDFDKVVKFTDGTVLECSTYSYTYSYGPDAIIFGKSATLNGKDYVMTKMLVEGEMYDMVPVQR